MCSLIQVFAICLCPQTPVSLIWLIYRWTYLSSRYIIFLNSQRKHIGWPRWLLWMRVQLVIRQLLAWPLLGRQHSFVEIDHEIFSMVSLLLIQEGQLSVSCKRMCMTLVKSLRGLSLPSKSVTILPMTPMGWLGHKTPTQTTKTCCGYSVAQLDAPSDWRPGGRGFNLRRGRQHSFVEIDLEIFSMVILSLPLIQEGQLSVSGERMCTILVNRLED